MPKERIRILGGGNSGVKVKSPNVACSLEGHRIELRVLKVAVFQSRPNIPLEAGNKMRFLACTL